MDGWVDGWMDRFSRSPLFEISLKLDDYFESCRALSPK